MGIYDRGAAASDDFMKYIMGVLAAAKKTPMNAREAANTPPLFRPLPVDPNALPIRSPITGQMTPVTRQYSPVQVGGARAAIAAPVVAGGYGANALLNDAPASGQAPVDYGMSDAQYRFKDLPGYDEEGRPQVGDKESYGLSDDAYRQLADLATSAGKSDAAYRAERPQRPVSTAAAAPAAAANAADPSFMGRLFGGQDFQSNNRAVVSRPQGPMSDGAPQRATLNWGDSDNAADFFRADKAMQGLRKNNEEFVGMASGGAANGSSSKSSGSGRDAAIHKALEIIHNLLMQRR
jgi:hypothetical protein